MSDPDEHLFAVAPFVSSTMRVEPAWIDYNGHLNVAYYHVLFDRALDEAFAVVGLGPDYVAERRLSYFVAELHTTFRRELAVDTAVRVTVQLVDCDEKRVHAYMEIHHLAESWTAATCELLVLHVDLTTRKVARFPDDVRLNLAAMKAVHGSLPRAVALGRAISLEAKPAPDRDAGSRER